MNETSVEENWCDEAPDLSLFNLASILPSHDFKCFWVWREELGIDNVIDAE